MASPNSLSIPKAVRNNDTWLAVLAAGRLIIAQRTEECAEKSPPPNNKELFHFFFSFFLFPPSLFSFFFCEMPISSSSSSSSSSYFPLQIPQHNEYIHPPPSLGAWLFFCQGDCRRVVVNKENKTRQSILYFIVLIIWLFLLFILSFLIWV